jgi:hypothetical protein
MCARYKISYKFMPNEAFSNRIKNYKELLLYYGSFDRFMLFMSTAFVEPRFFPAERILTYNFPGGRCSSRSYSCLTTSKINACYPCNINSLILVSNLSPILSIQYIIPHQTLTSLTMLIKHHAMN